MRNPGQIRWKDFPLTNDYLPINRVYAGDGEHGEGEVYHYVPKGKEEEEEEEEAHYREDYIVIDVGMYSSSDEMLPEARELMGESREGENETGVVNLKDLTEQIRTLTNQLAQAQKGSSTSMALLSELFALLTSVGACMNSGFNTTGSTLVTMLIGTITSILAQILPILEVYNRNQSGDINPTQSKMLMGGILSSIGGDVLINLSGTSAGVGNFRSLMTVGALIAVICRLMFLGVIYDHHTLEKRSKGE